MQMGSSGENDADTQDRRTDGQTPLEEAIAGLTLIDEKKEPRMVPANKQGASEQWRQRSLLGRVINPAVQQPAVVLRQMPSLWGLEGKVQGRELGDYKFQFSFEKMEDMERVLARGPWNFKKWLLILNKWQQVRPSNFWNQTAFWIRIRGIPIDYLSRDVIGFVAAEFGKVLEIDFDERDAVNVEYIRVRIEIDAEEPIIAKRAFTFEDGTEAEITASYERLSNFCYYCGCLNHEVKDCALEKTDLINRKIRARGLGAETRVVGTFKKNDSPPREHMGEAYQTALMDKQTSGKGKNQHKESLRTNKFKKPTDISGQQKTGLQPTPDHKSHVDKNIIGNKSQIDKNPNEKGIITRKEGKDDPGLESGEQRDESSIHIEDHLDKAYMTDLKYAASTVSSNSNCDKQPSLTSQDSMEIQSPLKGTTSQCQEAEKDGYKENFDKSVDQPAVIISNPEKEQKKKMSARRLNWDRRNTMDISAPSRPILGKRDGDWPTKETERPNKKFLTNEGSVVHPKPPTEP